MSAFGLPRVHHRTVDSTNERAKELARAGAPHGTIVTADEQTTGRGRQGRTWVAAPGSALLVSAVVRDLKERHAVLPLAAAVAVCEAVERCAPVACEIKWPNDVWIGGRKVAGILIEGRPQEGWAVLGLGINVSTAAGDFPSELRTTATSLAIESPGPRGPARDAVLAALLEALPAWLDADGGRTLDAWRRRDALRGRRIAWDGGAGTAAGVDGTGALLVEANGRMVPLDAGEVHLQIDV